MMMLSLSWSLFLFISLACCCVEGKRATSSFSTVQVQDDATVVVDDMAAKAETTTTTTSSACERTLKQLSLHPDDAFEIVWTLISLALHHNGEPEPCGVLRPPSLLQAWQQTILNMGEDVCEKVGDTLLHDKFQVEAFLTYFFLQQSDVSESCGEIDSEEETPSSFVEYCDMGPDKTVIQNDHDKLVRIPVGNVSYLPCRFYTREGLRIVSLSQLQELAKQKLGDIDEAIPTFDLYAVPAGRMFMFGPARVGEIFRLHHVRDSFGDSIALETLSLEPRVFDIQHFFSHDESEQLLLKAVRETSETHKFHRSTTGTTGAHVINKRTSENAWDTHGALAQKLKRRGFQLLGIDEYVEEMSDGMQILRYNKTNAYTNHMDYLNDPGPSEPYDYDSAGRGGNRFATILLYFTDVESGGETVFPKAWPPNVSEEDQIPLEKAIQNLRESGATNMLQENSWEEKMSAQCRTRLAVKPNRSRAVLFYSQYPNGELDPFSYHGACPVLNGTKVAANLWTWSAIRPEFTGAPLKNGKRKGIPDSETSTTAATTSSEQPQSLSGIFRNSGRDARFNENTKLFYEEDVFFGNLGPKDPPISVNTFKGHKWNVKVDGTTLRSFVIGDEGYQEFEI